MLTFQQVQNSTVQNIAGCEPSTPQFANYVNESVRVLCDLGDWFGSVQQMNGVAFGDCMTWPQNIVTVLAMNLDHRRTVVTNFWYDYVPMNGEFHHHFRDTGWVGSWRGGYGRSVVEFSGSQPLFAGPSPSNPFQIQVTADSPSDYGNTVTIYGFDTNGQEVLALRTDGSTQRGIQLTLAAQAPFTPMAFATVTHIAKDITTGNVRAFQYMPHTGQGILVGLFGGSQTSPEFLFSRLRRWRDNPSETHWLSALVKLGFNPVQQPSDILSIDNLDAIKVMVQAMKSRESGDNEKADQYEANAIRRLNMQVETRFPLDQVVARNEPFSGALRLRKPF